MQWFADQLYWLRRYCARHGLTVAMSLLLVYFLFHGLHGDRGYFARQDTQRLLQERTAMLDELQLERQQLKARVDAMAPGNSQADMVEEELYKLGYIKPGDVIIYRQQIDEAPAPQ